MLYLRCLEAQDLVLTFSDVPGITCQKCKVRCLYVTLARGFSGLHRQYRLYIGYGPLTVTVTTWIIPFLVGNPYKPSFATVTGWGVDPSYINEVFFLNKIYLRCGAWKPHWMAMARAFRCHISLRLFQQVLWVR